MKRGRLAVVVWAASFAVAALFHLRWRVPGQSWLCGAYGCSDEVWRVYQEAARHFAAHQPLYNLRNIDEFQYFPHAAIVFLPFQWLGGALGGVVWRALGWAVFGAGMWRLSKRVAPRDADELFLDATLLVLGPSAMALLSGQANLMVAAAALHATAELADRGWWRAAAWLMLALALKPIAAVMVLLTAVQYPSTRRPFAFMALILILLPFVVAPYDYMLAQYRDCWTKLTLSAQPNREFEDLGSLFERLGWTPPRLLMLAVELAAALGAAVTCRRLRRESEPLAALYLLAVASLYLMLFNPRTQPNSFVIAAPVVALAGARFWMEGRWRPLAVTAGVALAWVGALKLTAHWLRPLASLLLAWLLMREIWGSVSSGMVDRVEIRHH
jgi:hypothetical protein